MILTAGFPSALWAQGFTVTPRAQTYVPIAQIPGIGTITPITFADPDEDYQGPFDIGFRKMMLARRFGVTCQPRLSPIATFSIFSNGSNSIDI